MEIIGANRGVLPLNQPLEILTPNLTPHQYKRLPKFDLGQIVHPDPDQERELRAYTDDLMAGRIRVNAPHAFWRRDFQFRTDRLLLKIVDAKPMMDWFDATYHPDIAYLVRHPVPQAMSCIRNGWSTTTKAYLRNEWFADEVLADRELLAYAHKIDDSGTDLERFVLNWVVENLAPLRVLADRPHWLALSYEECVTDQDAVLRRVCERLDVGDTDRMRQAALRVSRSSALSDDGSVSAIRSGDRDEQVSGWLARMGAGRFGAGRPGAGRVRHHPLRRRRPGAELEPATDSSPIADETPVTLRVVVVEHSDRTEARFPGRAQGPLCSRVGPCRPGPGNRAF